MGRLRRDGSRARGRGARPVRLARPGRLARLAAGNAAALAGLLLVVGLAAEGALRLSAPFGSWRTPLRFVPGAGFLAEPGAEVRATNGLDFWTVSRANRLGFVDREPPDPEEAGGTCRVVLIGDSYVDAREVAIPDKVQVVLERLAAGELPGLRVRTAAFGWGDTGQVNQLPFYDRFARPLRPALLALVVYWSDFGDNSAFLQAIQGGYDPARMPFASAYRSEEGEIRLRPPHPEALARRRPAGSGLAAAAPPPVRRAWAWARDASRLLDWLTVRVIRPLDGSLGRLGVRRGVGEADDRPADDREADDRPADEGAPLRTIPEYRETPEYRALLEGWRRPPGYLPWAVALALDSAEWSGARLPPPYRDAVELTAFALDEFRERAERDGAELVLLAPPLFGAWKAPFRVMEELAAERGIPVLDLHERLVRRDGGAARIGELHFPNDIHWNPAGHRFAAEALLDHLRDRPEICGGAPA